MGRKVSPVIFRQSITKPEISSWISKKNNFVPLQQQDLEIRNFLSSLLRSQGILLRSCKISRASKKLLIQADFYFSYLFGKESKFFWARNLFRTIKKKHVELKKMRDLKNFVEDVEQVYESSYQPKSFFHRGKMKYALSKQKQNKCFLVNRKKNFVFKTSVLTYKSRFFFFLLMKKRKDSTLVKKENFSILGSVKNSSKPIFLRLKFSKLKKLFVLKKLKYDFRRFHLNFHFKKDKKNLLDLNKALCTSLHNFTGCENIHLRIYSTQLNFLPSLNLYQQLLGKKLFFFQKNKDLKKYYFESLEILYFVLGTFSYGNASLLGKFISYMIENNRKHSLSARFLNKALSVLFQSLPSNFFAVQGIKILIKDRFNKRRRTKTLVLQQGQISLQTLETPIDYYQTQAITLYGTFGIKVWLAKKTLV